MFGNVGKRNSFRRRKLRVEGLETRWMLAGDTGAVLAGEDLSAAAAADSDWSGFLVGDVNGNIMIADVEGSGETELLATTSVSLYDLAISAEGQVIGVATPVDGTSILYDYDVDFDNPGGFLDPTLIGYMVTNDSGVQINGIEFAPDGTLLASGYDYGGLPQGNHLYSVDVETGEATRLVNLGTHESAGDLAVDEEGTVYIPTLGADLISIPSDYSGYTVVGSLGYSTVYGMTYGPGPDLRGYLANGDVLNIDPTDASWFTEVTLTPGSTVTHPGALWGASTFYNPPTDLGEVDYVELTDQSPILETLWYRFDAMYDGYASVMLDGIGSTGNLDMVLHLVDGDGNLEEVDTGTTRVDYLEAVEGDRFYVEITGLPSDVTVRISNQVEPGTDTLIVHGSDESDVLLLEIGDPYLVDINGFDYEVPFDGASLVTTTFDAGTGADAIHVTSGDGDDDAEMDMSSRSGTFTGADYEVNFSSTAVMEFDGGDGHDTVGIVGTDADSEVHLEPFQGALLEGAVQASALNSEVITIDAAGGTDDVTFDGGSRADRLDLYPTSGLYREYVPTGELRDPTYSISVDNIESNYATSGGGIDAVYMRDSAGDETFMAGLGLVTYEGPGYAHEIHGFREVFAYGLNGGDDHATIYDTADNDKFKGKEDFGLLRGGGFLFRAKGFETVSATALYGGNDYAVMFDTAGDDLFTASYESAMMTDGTIVREATGFDRVLGRASGGYDIARLEDSPGNDELRCRSHKSVFRSRDDDSFELTARAFDEVYGEAVHGGDRDIAKFHDTPGDDHLVGAGDTAQFFRNDGGSLDLLYEAMAFETVKAYWTTGTNTTDFTPPLDYVYLEEFL